MSNMAKHRIAVEQRRQLHARIARSRRRINGHVSNFVPNGFLPQSWRRSVQENPIMALATAAGVGMLVAQMFSRKSQVACSGDWLAKWLAGGTWASIVTQWERFLTNEGRPGATSSEEATLSEEVGNG